MQSSVIFHDSTEPDQFWRICNNSAFQLTNNQFRREQRCSDAFRVAICGIQTGPTLLRAACRDKRAKDSVFVSGGPLPGDRIRRHPSGKRVARRVNCSCRRFRSSKIFVRRCRCRERAEAGVARFFLQQIAYASQGRSPNRVRSNHQRVTSRRVIRRGF